VENFKTNLVPI